MKNLNKFLLVILLALIASVIYSQTNSVVDNQHECVLGTTFVYQLEIEYERPQDDSNQAMDFIITYHIYPFNGFIQYSGPYYCSTNPNFNFKVNDKYYINSSTSKIGLREQ